MSKACGEPGYVAIAPATDGSRGNHDSDQPARPYSCLTCARRKVRCDKSSPACTTCRKARLDCEYQEPAPRKRKRKPVDNLYARLERYEDILKRNGLLPGTESTTTSSVSNRADRQNPSADLLRVPAKASGKLLRGHGKTRYIDSNIWRSFGEENFHASSDDEDEDQALPVNGQLSTADPVSIAILNLGKVASNLVDFHPTYNSAMRLWRLYTENVDPLVKLVHVPSGGIMLQRVAADPNSATKANEAVAFAVYHFALVTISDSDCLQMFGESRSSLLARYNHALRLALVNASLLKTTDLEVFQAYMLYLLAVRDQLDSHVLWVLTGIAVRIGQRMGLHRDGEEHGLSPFDVQMRRRAFWQLIPLDGIAAQLSGTGITMPMDSWDTKHPLNINDTDIWPDMTTTPEARTGATDMIFCLARSEMNRFMQKAHIASSDPSSAAEYQQHMAEKEHELQVLEERFETNYIRYCDFANPLHNAVMALCRGALNGGKLRIRLPRIKALKQLPEDERDKMWTISTKMMDLEIAVYKNHLMQGFLWHVRAMYQWHPLIWLLREIRQNPQLGDRDQIWSKFETLYEHHPEMVERKRSIYIAVGRVAVTAWDAYAAAHAPVQPAEPLFITKLRNNGGRRGSNGARAEQASNVSALDFASNLPLSNPLDTPWDTNTMDFHALSDANIDSLDWMFWDQLVQDPTSFRT